MASSPLRAQDQISLPVLKLPDPPDISSAPMEIETTLKRNTFKEILSEKNLTKSSVYFPQYHQARTMLEKTRMEDNSEPIILSQEQKLRIYHPWRFSIILKVFGKTIPHHVLKAKLQQLWTPTEQIILIDLGWEFFIVMFEKEENMTKALHRGSWFIMGYFLSVRNWEPNFVLVVSRIQTTAIWIRLP